MGFNFPTSPAVGALYPTPATPGVPQYRWDGQKWVAYVVPTSGAVRYDVAQALSQAEQLQALKNILAAPHEAFMSNNLVINGGHEINQEFQGAAVTIPNAGLKYPVDQWLVARNHTANTAVITGSQGVGGSPVSPNFLNMNANPGLTSPVAGDYALFQHRIEGLRFAKLFWGGGNAVPLALGFWSYATVGGTFTAGMKNLAGTRTFLRSFVQAAGTWQYNTTTFPGCQDGAWNTDNTCSAILIFTAYAGANFQAAPDVWQNANVSAVPTQTNFLAGASQFCVAGVSLTPGTILPLKEYGHRLVRPWQEEMLLCLRYFNRYASANGELYIENTSLGSGSNALAFPLHWPVPMRVQPTIVMPTWATAGVGAVSVAANGVTGASLQATSTVVSGGRMYIQNTSPMFIDARM